MLGEMYFKKVETLLQNGVQCDVKRCDNVVQSGPGKEGGSKCMIG
jgi:hypothetical protein